jgi:hypothetical protein
MRALSVHIAHETSGAARIRHSLRPLIFERARIFPIARAHRAARSRTHISCLKFKSESARRVCRCRPRSEVSRAPDAVQRRLAVHRRAGAHASSASMGPGSAAHHATRVARCAASGARDPNRSLACGIEARDCRSPGTHPSTGPNRPDCLDFPQPNFPLVTSH